MRSWEGTLEGVDDHITGEAASYPGISKMWAIQFELSTCSGSILYSVWKSTPQPRQWTASLVNLASQKTK